MKHVIAYVPKYMKIKYSHSAAQTGYNRLEERPERNRNSASSKI